ncbi:ribosomal protein L11 methyltransferase isoform X2 [Benincasa hispida]|uniref:ribosomal protein L11 methyltransferase isoform X2 n=1 Tax=Benincasa hispida TaxID=102211 RepID=UPI001901CA40|nr:ribosomal protein L11 methyltransferase isoform X2 [Benincasa hispida]
MAATAGKYLKNFSHCITSGIRIPIFPFSPVLTSPFSSTIHIRRQLLISPSLITQFSSSPTHYTSAKYLSVRIRCRKDIVDLLSEALLNFGASSTSVDEDDACGRSHEIYVDTIFPDGQDVSKCISYAADSVGLKELPLYEVTIGEQDDWLKKSQESFQPVKVMEGLWIVPEWTTPPDVHATNITLYSGLAFGTGEHPTTKLCLLLLHSLVKGGENFLDYGTGSGVLAIASLKFGAALSIGIDVDPHAIESAQQNAALNNIEPEKLQLHLIWLIMLSLMPNPRQSLLSPVFYPSRFQLL